MQKAKTAMLTTAGLALLLVLSLSASSCGKKAQPVAPASPADWGTASSDRPTAPSGPPPTVTISADPSTIERGSQTTLRWSSTNASSLVIDSGVGNVSENGSLIVSPLQSVTYTATAHGPGGEEKASTRVTVVMRSGGDLITTDIESLQKAMGDGLVKPVFFAYDKADLSPQARRTLEENARWFKRFPSVKVAVEGHCDERGTEEYNLALGDRRAQAARDYLVAKGVNAGQLITISFGEERPFSPGHDEASWRLNRRAHFVVER